jgi:GNAT superfamily N-acetyltransferase
VEIRPARPKEAEAVCDVLRRSITELCLADHGGDAAALADWLANKTPENVRTWIGRPRQRLLVAVLDGRIAGCACATESGAVVLNYVLPDFRFRGVSKALLAALEDYLAEAGNAASALESTATAYRFYRAAGYEDADPHEPSLGGDSKCRMRKALPAARASGATLGEGRR